MASGIIASLASSTSVTYTPLSDAKLSLACYTGNASAYISVNSVNVFNDANAKAGTVEIFVAAGVPVTVTVGTSAYCVVSALEA